MLNSIGVPPAARTPSLMCSARPRRWKLQGIASIQVLAIPIVGRLERLVVEADPLHVGARGGAVGAVEDGGRARPRQASRVVFAHRSAWARERRAPGPLAEPHEVAADVVGVELAARQVHVGRADQPALVAAQRHPLGEDVVGVGQALAVLAVVAVGEADAVLAEQLAGREVVGDDRLVRVDQVAVGRLDPPRRPPEDVEEARAPGRPRAPRRRGPSASRRSARRSARSSRPGSGRCAGEAGRRSREVRGGASARGRDRRRPPPGPRSRGSAMATAATLIARGSAGRSSAGGRREEDHALGVPAAPRRSRGPSSPRARPASRVGTAAHMPSSSWRRKASISSASSSSTSGSPSAMSRSP